MHKSFPSHASEMPQVEAAHAVVLRRVSSPSQLAFFFKSCMHDLEGGCSLDGHGSRASGKSLLLNFGSAIITIIKNASLMCYRREKSFISLRELSLYFPIAELSSLTQGNCPSCFGSPFLTSKTE